MAIDDGSGTRRLALKLVALMALAVCVIVMICVNEKGVRLPMPPIVCPPANGKLKPPGPNVMVDPI